MRPTHRVPKSNWLERKILLAVLTVVHRPRLTLIYAAILLLISGLSATLWLNVSSDQDKLFSEKLKAFHDYVEFDRKFPENDALYIVIEQKDAKSAPSVLRWKAAADAVAARVREMPGNYVESIDARVPLDKLGSQSLLFAQPDELRSAFDKAVDLSRLARLWGEPISAASALVQVHTPSARFLTALTLLPDRQAIPLVEVVASGWNQAIAHPKLPIQVGSTVPDLAAMGAEDPGDLGYYWQPDSTDPIARKDPAHARHLLLVRIYPHVNYNSLSATAEPIAAIRQAVAAAAKDFPEFTFGTTGRPALDADEMAATDRDSTIAEIIAAVAVFIGLLVMLRSLWLALVAEIALAVGIGWTFGWATVSVGELNLLSIVFLIALIGIGMDYLVQILMRYRTEARRHARAKAIWARVFCHVSAPINTACLGAAGAFLVSIFTNFRGAAELGIIAGGGLLLCLLSGYTVLPALLTMFPARLSVDVARRPTGLSPKPQGVRRLLMPAAWLCLVAAFSPWAFRAHFEPNLLDLQAPNLESTRLIRKIQTWSAVVLSKDKAMLARVRTAVERTKVVSKTDTLPSTESILIADDNYRWLAEHKGQLPKIDWVTPAPMTPADVESLAAKATALANRLSGLPPAGSSAERDEREAAIKALRAFAAGMVALPPREAAGRLSEWQVVFVAELRALLGKFSPGPLEVSKLPPELRNHFVSKEDGTYALYINPKPELDLWNQQDLSEFVDGVTAAVDTVPGHPDVTGLAPNVYQTTNEVRRSFTRATTYAFIAILILVLIDLRNLRHTLLAISVLAMGLPLLVELMGFLNVNWNFANFFGLPILIGAGHEYGVFMIHRYREARKDPRRVWRFWDVADRALLLCAYVTSTSFGFFWAISEHRGLKSLGLVMALGTACIYLSTIMVLRPLLLWRLERCNE